MHGLLGTEVLLQYLVRAVVIAIALPFHESAHALVSYWLGDDTAVRAGRLSMNPLRHFEPMGALCLVLGGIGWAKPVGINARNYRNPKVGMAVSAAAGPFSNLLLAYLSLILYKVVVYAGLANGLVLLFLQTMVSLNISLAVFNLIPVPPFDGSRIALLFLPQKYYFKVMQYERYIMIGVFVLVLAHLLDAPLGMAVNLVWGLLLKLTAFVEPLFGF